MKETRSQVSDIHKQIRDCKDARKSLSAIQKKLQEQVEAAQSKRSALSETIKRLVGTLHSIQTISRDARPAKRKSKEAVTA